MTKMTRIVVTLSFTLISLSLSAKFEIDHRFNYKHLTFIGTPSAIREQQHRLVISNDDRLGSVLALIIPSQWSLKLDANCTQSTLSMSVKQWWLASVVDAAIYSQASILVDVEQQIILLKHCKA